MLVVDDDPSVTASLALLLKQHGYRSAIARTPQQALELLRREPFDLLLQDMNFSRATSGREGLELLREARALHPELPVILITAWGSIGLAVEGMRAGATDFLTKPWSNAHLLRSLETALSLAGVRAGEPQRPALSREELDARGEFRALVGRDPAFLRLLELAGRVAATDAAVLISGESGTGKELLAEAIHRNSRRRDAPFVKVNLGGISSTLFESEMFGHVRGAFTDARRDRQGRFEVADGGTIFLDEIGELDPGSQVKLLRVLQDRSYEVLGSSQTRSVDVRVVSATNRDLGQLVRQGSFREDLLYRLNLIELHLPPLRERPGDIALLAADFLAGCAREYGRAAPELTERAVQWLAARSWPGNVRELRQTLARALLVGEGARLDAEDLRRMEQLSARDPHRPELPSPGAMTLDEMERAMIVQCLKHYAGNLSRAADALGLSRAALYRRLEKYGLDPRG
ncbi:MAG TPA: sigma-54 dependent transcriptional regulator [Candidatus Polarisedimenticolaceae bacterium]|nr:sigma-54 dependent transcriptional regulator [Candidatus Polarisedimenticolaceae bacterium]